MTRKIRVEQVVKRFGDVLALGPCSLEVSSKEFLCLIGPSGCGKTTLLRLVGGLIRPERAARGLTSAE